MPNSPEYSDTYRAHLYGTVIGLGGGLAIGAMLLGHPMAAELLSAHANPMALVKLNLGVDFIAGLGGLEGWFIGDSIIRGQEYPNI